MLRKQVGHKFNSIYGLYVLVSTYVYVLVSRYVYV